jgi:hypothetical protein
MIIHTILAPADIPARFRLTVYAIENTKRWLEILQSLDNILIKMKYNLNSDSKMTNSVKIQIGRLNPH